MKFPNINTTECPPTGEAKACPQNSDPNLQPSLILKPELLTICASGTIHFTTFLRNGLGGEVQILTGLTYASSNPSIVSIDATTGIATVLGAGIVTISVQWQAFNAFAQVTVLGGENCCDDIKVGTVIAIDRSPSMGRAFNSAFATLLDVAKNLANVYAGAILAKDVDAIEQFAGVASIIQPFTNNTSLLQAAINGITLDTIANNLGDTDIKAAFELAKDTLDDCSDCDRKVILLLSDGQNRPPLNSADHDALVNEADAFKAAGGIIICVGIRAAGDGFSLLQELSSGGFFLNVWGSGAGVVSQAGHWLQCMMGNFCAGENTPDGYGYGCDDPPPAQVPDPSPLVDNENGVVPPQIFTSTKTACASCPPGTENDSIINMTPVMTSNTTPSGEASASSEFIAGTAFGAFDHEGLFPNQGWISFNNVPIWLQYRFTAAITCLGYAVSVMNVIGYNSQQARPSAWEFQGSNDGSSWTTLDTQSGHTWCSGSGTCGNQRKEFSIAAATYKYFRIYVTACTGTTLGDPYAAIGISELEILGHAPNEVCATATAESDVSQADADQKATDAATTIANSQLFCVGSDNTHQITINDNAPATPYPSRKIVSGMSGAISKVVVQLKKFSHTYPNDVQVVLQSPSGKTCLLMWNCGGSFSVSNLNFTFDDAAGSSLPDATILSSGTFKPTSYPAIPSLQPPGPPIPYGAPLSVFNGEDPNGVWKLWVNDRLALDVGKFQEGWDMTITTA